jgi:AcrR family transcriptional regulator
MVAGVPRTDSEQRERILDAAVRVFGEKGRRGTTIRMVGAEAGVNSALIYYYFENKEELFVEGVRMVLRGFLAELEADRRTFRNGRQRLAWLVDHVFHYYCAYPERLRLMALAIVLHGKLMGQCLQPIISERIPLPIVVLREGMDAGELKKEHPVAAWWNIISLCVFGLFMKDVVAGIDWTAMPVAAPDVKKRRDQIVELLADGMAVAGR